MTQKTVIWCGKADAAAFPELPDVPLDPNSWGSRKLEAIRKRRAEMGDGYTQPESRFAEAKAWVEANIPEFRGSYQERKDKGLPC